MFSSTAKAAGEPKRKALRKEKEKAKPPKSRQQKNQQARGPPSPARNANAKSKPALPGVRPQQQQHIYNSPFAAASTSIIPNQNMGQTHARTLQPFQSTLDVSRGLAGQLYHTSVDVAKGASETTFLQEALSASISNKFNSVITAIDDGCFSGEERDLVLFEDDPVTQRAGETLRTKDRSGPSETKGHAVSTVKGANYFAKANLYANSRLPANLHPLQLYLPSYQLLCLAAQYSTRAYSKASGSECSAFINADWRLGTKAMVIKSVPIDHVNCIVFAIRGSQTFMDWAVNLHSSPESPEGFLDDPGNLCHSGFLSVARKMVKPVAARLRQLLEENPARSTCSLLMTGHSAGGAVASLLYAHMLAENPPSELNILTGCFKRIHCLTFGAPPVSLLPLKKPRDERNRRSLFMSFINEGDPVPRADPAYVRSLLRLYSSPSPTVSSTMGLPSAKPMMKKFGILKKNSTDPQAITSKDFVWDVPPGTLSNAGRIVVLRGKGREDAGTTAAAVTAREEDVQAYVTSDHDLRNVVFGDPMMHMMTIYSRRIEVLATRAVTAGFTTQVS